MEVVLHLMSIMPLLVLNIGSIQYVMNLLANVLNALNEAIHLGSLRLDMSQINPSSCKGHGYVNGT
jgi:hypothetical protein